MKNKNPLRDITLVEWAVIVALATIVFALWHGPL